MDKRINNGGNSTIAKRPDDKRLATKTERQDAYNHLSPLSEKAIEVHADALENGERWAVELFYKYYFKLPTQTVDQNTNVNLNTFSLKDVIDFDNTK
jgi:hypothetical protein